MRRTSIKSDLARLERLKDRDIDYSEIPPLNPSFLKKAIEAWPPAKQQVTVRLDVDVLDWLKLHGKGYQTRLNRILRATMEHQVPRRPRTPKSPARSRRRPRAA
ncbi:MAG: BrnA antitoxin family protein [Nitrospira sp.]|nr:BrnA antitoxin family protein [Nitrospira sp.]